MLFLGFVVLGFRDLGFTMLGLEVKSLIRVGPHCTRSRENNVLINGCSPHDTQEVRLKVMWSFPRIEGPRYRPQYSIILIILTWEAPYTELWGQLRNLQSQPDLGDDPLETCKLHAV